MTGNLGYIGSVLSTMLIEKGYNVIGLDTGYFKDCLLVKETDTYKTIYKDIREVDESDLEGIDHIIHLAGLSNDPLGEFSPSLTEQINHRGTVEFAKKAKRVGVKRFVFASSQSMYGVANLGEELDEETSAKNPVTAYAKTKWDAEKELKALASKDYTVVSFRPSTVFGASPRLRCDIVFNSFVASAYTTGKIEIKSDGTPWRPVVHVKDVSKALIAGVQAPSNLVNGKAYNVGIPNGNFTVRELAEAVQKEIPDSTICFTGEHGKDSRTYKVSFKRILSELKGFYQPTWNLSDGARELIQMFEKIGLDENEFRGEKTIRLMKLKNLTKDKKIDNNLMWSEAK
ncbi:MULTISPECIES: NAD(P)-dependent oxidoreductase [unclassified Synechococcus]|uniref:NAD-dependent epimerase/dehydratase family protein n=1 Tax=unclassified Synechococcus TaxID=2626047 RepID=UPI0019D2E2D8|nr:MULTISPECIES: NAD(P)-dependent oxidoreductase [unclassified Synechococcus]